MKAKTSTKNLGTTLLILLCFAIPPLLLRTKSVKIEMGLIERLETQMESCNNSLSNQHRFGSEELLKVLLSANDSFVWFLCRGISS